MKELLRHFFLFLSSMFHGRYAGKWLGALDYCRSVICSNKKTFAGQLHERINLDQIIPKTNSKEEDAYIEKTDKIKVRIMYPAGCSWNNIRTLYEAFCNDNKFQTYIVVDNYPRFIHIMKQVGCNYITLDKYDIKVDCPDIFVATYYSSSNKEINFPGVHKYVKTIFAAIPNVVMNEKNDEIHWSFIKRAYSHLEPDYYLCEKPVYQSLKLFLPNEKVKEVGNPQYDEIHRVVGKIHNLPNGWEKIRGKKTFLWATDHGINESRPTNGFTIDLYLGPLLKYFSEHTDRALIFRPHPEFIREIQFASHFWNHSDIQRIQDYFASTPNCVWDDTHDYCFAFDACDAFMVDLNCSLICAALTTGKPICRLQRTDIDEWQISPELSDCYYYAKGLDEIVSFIDTIMRDNDRKGDNRKLGIKKSILHFDGNNGNRMKNEIVQLYKNSQDMTE